MSKQSKDFLEWAYIFLIAVLMLLSILLIDKYKSERDINDKLNIQIQQLSTPEVINGNLYIGYENGIRIGYYQWNNSWYRNGVEIK